MILPAGASCASPLERYGPCLLRGPHRQTRAAMFRLVLFGGAVIASCASPASLVPANPLPAGVWQVEAIGEGPAVQGVQSTVQFEATGEVHGLGGCNRFSGTYRLADDTLRIGPLAATKMACADAVMAHEAQFFAALEDAERFELTDGRLLLVPKTGGTEVRFVLATP